MENKKLVIILMGAPGAGKGTQAELLAERLNLYYLETSKVLEETFLSVQKNDLINVGSQKFSLKKEKILWQTGKLCDPPFVSYLVREKIKEISKKGKNLILAGSPRTVFEGKEVVPLLKKLYGQKNIKVILLDISPQETIFRNSHRRICQLMRHPIVFSKETKNLTICPLDGSKLMRRKGLDDPETIKVRLKEYKERTYPIIDYFKKEKLSLKIVDGSPSPAVIFENLIKSFK